MPRSAWDAESADNSVNLMHLARVKNKFFTLAKYAGLSEKNGDKIWKLKIL